MLKNKGDKQFVYLFSPEIYISCNLNIIQQIKILYLGSRDHNYIRDHGTDFYLPRFIELKNKTKTYAFLHHIASTKTYAFLHHIASVDRLALFTFGARMLDQ